MRERTIGMATFLTLVLVLLNPQGFAVGIGVNPSQLDYYSASDYPISKEAYVINTTSTSSMTSSIQSFPLAPSDPHIVSALAYLANQQASDGDIGGFGTSCWVTMAIASAGQNPNDWTKNGTSITDYLISNQNQIDENTVTDIAKFILTMTAAKIDPTNVGGTNYVSMLEGKAVNGQFGALYNDNMWAIIALISAGVDKSTPEIVSSVSYLKSHQNADGGWSWTSGPSDADDTAAAMMALISAGENGNSPPITKALSYLKSQLGSGGGFTYDGDANSASDSWAIMALTAANINPTALDWTKNGTSPVDHLIGLQNQDGSFSWVQGQPGSAWWTAYAIPALLGKPYPVTENPVQTYATSSQTSTTSSQSSIATAITAAVSSQSSIATAITAAVSNQTSTATAITTAVPEYPTALYLVLIGCLAITILFVRKSRPHASTAIQIFTQGMVPGESPKETHKLTHQETDCDVRDTRSSRRS